MSLKGTIRNSWEVWRRKVDAALGGSVEDIKASEVLFDKTDTSLTSSDVQGALVELDAEDDVLTEDIGGLKERMTVVEGVTTAVHGKYAIVEYNTFEVTADGVKTTAALLNEIYSNTISAMGEMSNDELMFFDALNIPDVGNMIGAGKASGYDNSTDSYNAAFFRASAGTNNMSIISMRLRQSSAVISSEISDQGAVTITNKSSSVPAENTVITLTYHKIKKV